MGVGLWYCVWQKLSKLWGQWGWMMVERLIETFISQATCWVDSGEWRDGDAVGYGISI